MEKLYATLHNAQQAHTVLNALWQQVKPWLITGHRLQVEIKPEKRRDAQNALLHATLTDIAKQKEWFGRTWDAEVWKRLLTAAWLRARGDAVVMVPALDGAGVDVVFRRTSELTVAECSELQEYVFAWGTENGVVWSREPECTT